jgi:hypothetical protein
LSIHTEKHMLTRYLAFVVKALVVFYSITILYFVISYGM